MVEVMVVQLAVSLDKLSDANLVEWLGRLLVELTVVLLAGYWVCSKVGEMVALKAAQLVDHLVVSLGLMSVLTLVVRKVELLVKTMAV